LLFPIDWPEPFGLVMIEAMACNDLDSAAEAVRRVPELDRRVCRSVFETRFTASRMADDYLKIFEQMAQCGDRKYAELATA
jgi:glycosyltransferase involved in cell wall biosynthesis